MSNKSDKTITDIVQAVRESDEKKTKPYDTTATVTRVEDGKAWVHIPGGVAETPAELTINAKQGDSVMVRVAGGRAFLLGNATNPPTDDSTAETALANANDALQSAINARIAADSAEQSAEVAQASAETASTAAAQAVTDAATANANAQTAIADAAEAASAASQAQTSADSAQASAENANEYAARALGNLSTVQSVTETLNWITQHGTMTRTTDTALDPTHVYFVQDSDGDYVVGNVHYSIVTEPKLADISTYYELSIDESLNNYVATHLAVTSEGLWIIPDAGGNKVLIATGQGSTYTSAGTYIIKDDEVLAKFTESNVTLGNENTSHAIVGNNSFQFYHEDGNTRAFLISQGIVRVGQSIGQQYAYHQELSSKGIASVFYPYLNFGKKVTFLGLETGETSDLYTVWNNQDKTYTLSKAPLTGSYIYLYTSGAPGLAYNLSYVVQQGVPTTFPFAPGTMSYDGEQEFIFTSNPTIYGSFSLNIKYDTEYPRERLQVGDDFFVENGEVKIALDTSATSGTDKEIYDALVALGWESDVIS